ncbi:hypothetical protein Hanom_Chr04g00284701 [Helianthus anomalus]
MIKRPFFGQKLGIAIVSSKTLSNIKANSRRGLTSIVVETRRLRFTTFVPFHDIFLLFLSNI